MAKEFHEPWTTAAPALVAVDGKPLPDTDPAAIHATVGLELATDGDQGAGELSLTATVGGRRVEVVLAAMDALPLITPDARGRAGRREPERLIDPYRTRGPGWPRPDTHGRTPCPTPADSRRCASSSTSIPSR